jgi:hypothetical protein
MKERNRIALVVDPKLGKRLEVEKVRQERELSDAHFTARLTLSDVIRGLLERALEQREATR